MGTVTRTITDRGIVLLCGASLLVIAGLFSQNGELMTLGVCGLIVVGAGFVVAPRNLRDLQLKLHLPHRFHASRSVPLEVEIENPRRMLDAYAVEVRMRFPQGVERSGHANWTPTGTSAVLHERLSIPVRSSTSEVGYEFHSSFPLGLFEARSSSTLNHPLLVYPRLITPLELLVDGAQPDLMPIAGTAAGDAFGEPRGIRPYQPGDAANRIHQAATARSLARGHGLRVRAYDPPGFHPLNCRIVFHSYASAGELIRFDRFERGLSLVAGTLVYLQSVHTSVTLQADFTNWLSRPCENRSQTLECLALLAKTKRSRHTSPEQLAEILQKVPPDEQLILISDAPPEHWNEAIPSHHQQAIVVDIRQIRFKKRRMQLAP